MDEQTLFIHESAYVDQGAIVKQGSKIWHFSHVMDGAEIGMNCTLGQNVFVARGARIGNNVKIQNNVSVYEGIILEDDVFCGPSVVFTNVKTPRAAFPRNRSEDYLTTHVKKGVSLGANCTIVCGVTIHPYAFVAAGSVVTRDVPAHAVIAGVPALLIGWACECGTILKVDQTSVECPICNRIYEVDEDGGIIIGSDMDSNLELKS